LMVEANSKLRKLLNKDFSITDMFQYPTVSSLAEYLSKQDDDLPSYQQSRDRARMQKEAVSRRKQPAQRKPTSSKEEGHE